jgi:hypothetical protein
MIRIPASLARRALALTAATALAAGAAFASDAAAGEKPTKLELVLGHGDSRDRLTVDDLGTIAVGDQQSFTTEQGKTVTVRRDEKGYELSIDGRQVRVDDLSDVDEGAPGERRVEKIVIADGAGAPRTMVFRSSGTDGQGERLRVEKRVGPDGEQAFAFRSGDAPPPLGIEATIDRLQKNPRFQKLDAATRATVLEALRESAPAGPVWIEKDEPGAPGEKVIVLHLDDRRGDAH